MSKPFGINVTDYGLVGDYSTDNSPALRALVNANIGKGVKLLVPSGKYVFRSKVELSQLGHFSVEGESVQQGGDGGACFIGVFNNDPMISIDYGGGNGSFDIRNMNFAYYGTGGSAVFSSNSVGSNFNHCRFSAVDYVGAGAKAALNLQSGFSTGVHNCSFGGFGKAIGLLAFGPTGCLVSNCDFMGCGEGIRAAGTGLSVIGSRFEVNGIGLRLGADPNGNNYGFYSSVFHGLSMEANDIDILCQVVNSCHFSGIGTGGSAGSPSHGSKYGIDMAYCQNTTFSGVGIGGAYSQAGIRIQPTGSTFNICFDSVRAPSWVVPAPHGVFSFRCCNQPAGL